MRLDNYLVENGYFDSRTKAKQAIERGEILVEGKLIVKSSYEMKGVHDIKRVYESEYVSLGGFKLDKALSDFKFNVKDLVVADIGASTGGFTDCLIKNGARKVYAVDLRDDLLHDKLKNDSKVNLIVKNAKDLSTLDFNDKLDLIVADLSFISIVQVLNVFSNLIDNDKYIIILIKPQFETGHRTRFKNGIIRDKKIHKNVCENVYSEAIKCGLSPINLTTAPKNQDKNLEFLILLKKGGKIELSQDFMNFL